MNMNQSTDAISNAGGYKSADVSRSFIQNKDDIDLESVDEGSVREVAHYNASASSSGTETFNVMDCFKKAKAPVVVASNATGFKLNSGNDKTQKENRGGGAAKPKGSQSRGKLQLKQSPNNF